MTAEVLSGQRCLVVGLGRFGGGAGAVRWAVESRLEVTLTDRADEDALADPLERLRPTLEAGAVRTVLGGHAGLDPRDFDLVIANPAVPPSAPLLAAARAAGVRVTSEVELWLERTPARVLAVTGTQGKSSTVTFLAQLLTATGTDARVGGNLGGSLLATLADDRPETTRVVELSSYQLEGLGPQPRRAARGIAVTNVLADHLDRHGDLAGYAAAKRRLLELCAPGGVALLPTEGPAAAWRPADLDVRGHGPGGWARVEGDRAWLGEDALPLGALELPPFQRANVLVALAAARALGLEVEPLVHALPRLRPPHHRCEALPARLGRRILDNGVATTPDATLGILEAIDPGATLLLGGHSKGLPWGPLLERLAARGDRVVAFGAAAEELRAACAETDVTCSVRASLEAAVEAGLDDTPAGATLVFSPSCASFDAYANFEQRARHFRASLEPFDSPGASASGPGGSSRGAAGV
ncbi:MAG: UDP-N-acetylmuramoyl-L-alanine--D-glutamate ligase [Planctomycetota bacterium]